VKQVDGVLEVSQGSFSNEYGAIYLHTLPKRLCVVNENVVGVLGHVAYLLEVELSLKILSQVNRSRGSQALNVFVMENKDVDWDFICKQVEEIEHVQSCSVGRFQAGGLFQDESPGSHWSDGHLSFSEGTKSRHSHAFSPVFGERLSVIRDVEEDEEQEDQDLALNGDVIERANSASIPRSHLPHELPSVAAVDDSVLASPKHDKNVALSYYDGGSKETTRSKTLTLISERGQLTKDASKLVVVMVGLPARGKSFTSRKLKRFLCWRNSKAKIFNAGKYRRERSAMASDKADFFDESNEEGTKIRQEAANRALGDLLEYLRTERGSCVGIFDATNSTVERRQWIVAQATGLASVVFVEVICDDEEVLLENLLSKVRGSPDYAGMDEEEALKDLQGRVANYEKVYETVDDDSMSYIKIFNMSSKIMANKVYGRLARSLLPYMLSLHVGLRPIYFVRAGLAEDAKLSALNADAGDEFLDPSTESKGSNLSEHGKLFAKSLARWLQTALWVRDDIDIDGDDDEEAEDFVEQEINDIYHDTNLGRAYSSMRSLKSRKGSESAQRLFNMDRKREVRRGDGLPQKGAILKVLSSTLPRAQQTAQEAVSLLNGSSIVELCSMLNPLDKGELGAMSMEEIKVSEPDFYEIWSRNPYHHRFPGGESYFDLVTRLEPVLIEMEQQTAPVLVVSHVSCIQVLLAYFLGRSVEEAMKIHVPLHKVVEITPTVGGSWEKQEFDV